MAKLRESFARLKENRQKIQWQHIHFGFTQLNTDHKGSHPQIFEIVCDKNKKLYSYHYEILFTDNCK